MSVQDIRWLQRFNHFVSRNLTSHLYDEATAAQLGADIREAYFAEFEALRVKLDELRREEGA
ncbi:MAG: nucleotidyltransferase substrate binding protein [candidate division KSB1 bacterium]|nr:nucleotidyltransferase substrate binding protein [candidate division KSB1 bacterium]MDZ7407130.1 nucleotidyltransferase substrate binding protein [candidate division KSB1 bacterium]